MEPFIGIKSNLLKDLYMSYCDLIDELLKGKNIINRQYINTYIIAIIDILGVGGVVCKYSEYDSAIKVTKDLRSKIPQLRFISDTQIYGESKDGNKYTWKINNLDDPNVKDISSSIYLPINDKIVSSRNDNKLRIWDEKLCECYILEEVPLLGYKYIGCIIGYSGILIIDKGSNLIRIWNLDTRTFSKNFNEHYGIVTGITSYKNNIISYTDREVICWDLYTYKTNYRITSSVKLVKIMNMTFIVQKNDGVILIYDIVNGDEEDEIKNQEIFQDIIINGNFIIGLNDKGISICNFKESKIFETINILGSIIINFDTDKILIGQNDGNVMIFDVRKRQDKYIFKQMTNKCITKLAILKDNSVMAQTEYFSTFLWI